MSGTEWLIRGGTKEKEGWEKDSEEEDERVRREEDFKGTVGMKEEKKEEWRLHKQAGEEAVPGKKDATKSSKKKKKPDQYFMEEKTQQKQGHVFKGEKRWKKVGGTKKSRTKDGKQELEGWSDLIKR